MKLKNLFTLLFLFVGLFSITAQDDCDCPEPEWDTDGICVEIEEDGETLILWMPDECHADCLLGEDYDYTIVDCGDSDWEWEDECECDEEDWEGEGICIEVVESENDTLNYITWAPSECYAACWYEDYTVVECEENDWEWEDECECDEEDWEGEGICVEVSDSVIDTVTYTTWVPSECYAACWYDEYTVVDCIEDDWEWEDECECDEDDWNGEGICIEVLESEFDTLGVDTIAFITWVPSECYAACWYDEYTVVDCIEDDWEWEDECDCDEDDWNSEGICVEVAEGGETYTAWVPSECYAGCWYEDYAVVDCIEDDWEWEDECDCDEDDWNSEGICVEVAEGGETYTTWVPSECYAGCWYEDYTVVDCPEGGEGPECDWDAECDCEIDSEEGICIAYVYSDTLFGIIDTLIEWVPNECFADCWGFVDYSVVDCEDLWDWEEEDETEIEIEGDAECIVELLETEDLTFQAFLFGLHECEALELDDCVLAAPIFDTDEEFIDYLIENCPEWFGNVMDESEGPSLFNSYEQSQEENAPTSTQEIEGMQVKVLGNPVVDQLNVSINTSEAMNLNMVLTSTAGKVLNVENIRLAKGEQVYQLNTANLAGGVYHLAMRNVDATQTIKFVVVK